MGLSLKPESLAVESAVITPQLEDPELASDPWYTNTRPIPASNTGCTTCWAVNQP